VLSLRIFKRIVFIAALVGLLAGLVLTGVQKIQVGPLILQAEVAENAALVAKATPHTHVQAQVHTTGDAEHHHASDSLEWQPKIGWERIAFTALANVSLAMGFALMLGAAMTVHNQSSGWRQGLIWGAAGYLVFFVMPSLGLPPEAPGTEAAPLVDRQTWWFITVLAAAAALSLLVFARLWQLKLLGVGLLFLPYLIGVPQPLIHQSSTSAELAHTFVIAAAVANGIFWLVLGGLTGYFHKDSGDVS
jgi:cobalt transporter subunit CbtA